MENNYRDRKIFVIVSLILSVVSIAVFILTIDFYQLIVKELLADSEITLSDIELVPFFFIASISTLLFSISGLVFSAISYKKRPAMKLIIERILLISDSLLFFSAAVFITSILLI